MLALITPRFLAGLAIVLLLAVSHGFAYKAGRADVHKAWDKEKLVQLQQAKDQEYENRNIETARIRNVLEAQNKATKRGQALRVATDNARTQSDGLRGDIKALRLQLPSYPPSAVNQYADTASTLLSECSRAYSDMAQKADGHSSDTLMLLEAWPK